MEFLAKAQETEAIIKKVSRAARVPADQLGVFVEQLLRDQYCNFYLKKRLRKQLRRGRGKL